MVEIHTDIKQTQSADGDLPGADVVETTNHVTNTPADVDKPNQEVVLKTDLWRCAEVSW